MMMPPNTNIIREEAPALPENPTFREIPVGQFFRIEKGSSTGLYLKVNSKNVFDLRRNISKTFQDAVTLEIRGGHSSIGYGSRSMIPCECTTKCDLKISFATQR